MGAMKRLNLEYQRSGWNLVGFPRQDRAIWRRLLPPEARPHPPVAFADPSLVPPWEQVTNSGWSEGRP